jgi:hypothetical protein
MTITLKPEQEQVVKEAIKAGYISSAEEAFDITVESLRSQLATKLRGRNP